MGGLGVEKKLAMIVKVIFGCLGNMLPIFVLKGRNLEDLFGINLVFLRKILSLESGQIKILLLFINVIEFSFVQNEMNHDRNLDYLI